MSLPIPPEPEEGCRGAHVFGESCAGAAPDVEEVAAKQLREQLDSTALEDWQTLFARVYGAHRGAA